MHLGRHRGHGRDTWGANLGANLGVNWGEGSTVGAWGRQFRDRLGGGRHHRNDGHGNAVLVIAVCAVVAGVAAFAITRGSSMRNNRRIDAGDAPRHTVRRRRLPGRHNAVHVGRTVTINRPRKYLFSFWRDFSRLPQFMENVQSITVIDDKRSRWVVKGPGEMDVTFETEITEEVPGEVIAWRSSDDADVKHSGRILFRDAPDGRGTEVEAAITYVPPGGRLGQLLAKLAGREPEIQTRRELKRFKQLMETGEIADAAPRPSARA